MNLEAASKLATDHLAKHGLSDITKEKLEQHLITKHSDEFCADIRAKLNRGAVNSMGFKPIQHLLSPKNRYVFDYRKAAIIDPCCLGKYTTLVLQAADDIEAARIPAHDQIVFSSRFAPREGSLFDPAYTYGAWRERVKKQADSTQCTYVVQCDIAAFYDRVNIHRLESTLIDVGVEKSVVKHINELLLLWSRKDSYGLPVGNAASRILAEAALIDIDNYLVTENVAFARYVDDYRLFAPNLRTAQRWMNLLTSRLFRDGLMLNTGKTRLYLAAKSDSESTPGDAEDEPEAIIKKVTRLTGGYNRVARVFLMPAAEKYTAFKSIDIAAELASIESNGIPEFEGIQKLIIASLVQEDFARIEDLAVLCSHYLYSLDYFTDMLVKNASVIPTKHRDRIADTFVDLLASTEFGGLDWHQATLASLLLKPEYFRKTALIEIVRRPAKESSTYPSMIALEGLAGKLTRGEFKTIREWFDRCDDFERRRVLAASGALPGEERRAWAKAVRPTIQADMFSARMADEIARGREV